MKNFILLFLFLITIFKDTIIYCNNCEKVANLPKDFESLLPNYTKLNRFHLLNYFFLESEHSNSINVDLKDKSILKLLAIPKLADVKIEITLPNMEKIHLNGYQDIPVDYLNLNLSPGQLRFTFELKVSGESEKTNKICNSPFFQLEILIENKKTFQQRNSKLKKDLRNLDDFHTFFDDAFRKVSDAHNLPLQIDYDSYKLSIKELAEYRSMNVSILADFDLEIEDKEIVINPIANETSKADDTDPEMLVSKKYLIDFNIYSDFLYGGSFFLALIRKEDIEKGELLNHRCLFNDKCILSERPNKNNIILQSILTPGSYKILLFNFIDDNEYEILKKNIVEVPITAKLEVKTFTKDENRYNCPGRHLPKHLDFLKDKYSNDYLEYSGDIIMNTEKLHDEITFLVEEDSLLRIIAFAHSGENIDLELYHIPQVGSEFQNLIKTNNNDENRFGPLADILNKIFAKKKSSDAAADNLKQISEHFGDSDGLLIPLMKGNTYKVIFNYKNSIISETYKKFCEMYYVKIGLSKISSIKKTFPLALGNSCPNSDYSTRKKEMNKVLKDLSDDNSSSSNSNRSKHQQIYDSFEKGFNSVFRAFFDRNQAGVVIYNGKFQIENTVNIQVEILSDFVTSFLVPIIIQDDTKSDDDQINIDQLLNHKHQVITFHENHIKLNLQKGNYRLLIINGVSQFYNEEDLVQNSKLLNFIDLDNLPKCLEFQIRITAQKLLNQRMLNWECNSKDFEFLPNTMNNLLYLGNDKLKTKFSYFSKHLLLPLDPHSMKIKTGKEGYLMRLVHEFENLEEEGLANENNKSIFVVTLNKNKKILRTSKPIVVENELKSNIQYITYFLKANSEYELIYEFDAENKHYDYYEKCQLFKLEISFISERLINNSNELSNNIESNCHEFFPKIEDIAYERIIGLTNSFFKYGSNSILQMFMAKTIFGTSKSLIDQNAEKNELLDLETSHPTSSMIQFIFDPSKSKPFSQSYKFEVRSALARVTIAVENPYSGLLGISFKLFFVYDEIEELVAIEDMDEHGYFSLKGVQLEMGKYRVEFYANNLLDYKKDFSIYKNNFKKICVNFSAHILIENRPFDFVSKHVSENYISCPYNSFPLNLNTPGWLSRDTGYSINLMGKFKIDPNETKVHFRIYETSLFKFHIPDEHDNIFSYINLYKISGNSKKKLKEKLESKDNYINLILEKGSYLLDFTFRGVQDSTLNQEKKCLFFEAQLIINPSSNTIDGIKTNNDAYCNQNLLNTIQHNTNSDYNKLVFINEKNENEKMKHVIKIEKSRKKGSFLSEFILNPYLDTNFRFKVFEKFSDENDSEKKEFPAEVIYSENMIWLYFHSNSQAEYFIEIIAESFDNYSICSNIVFSYNHEDHQKDSEVDQKDHTDKEIKNENLKKNNCKVYDHLPAFLFSEKNAKNTILEKYGGPQEADGHLDIYGEFLLPIDSPETRTTFYINVASMIYVKVIPKYSREANVYIEVYRDKNVIYRYSHNDYMGVLLYHLEPSKSPYILNLTFDKTLEDVPCGSYELIISIIPRDIYKNEYLDCDDTNEKLPESIIVDKAQTGVLKTHLKAEKDDLNKMEKDKEGNYYKLIKLDLQHSYAAMLMIEYIDSDNFLDIILEEEDEGNKAANANVLEIGTASHSLFDEGSGILTKKVISVNLKKGVYRVKIYFHKMFRNLLKRTFKKELDDLCLNYELTWEFSELHLKHDIEKNKGDVNSAETNEKDINSEIDLKQIESSEKVNPDKISILAVEPPMKKSLKLYKHLEIDLKFSSAIDLDQEFANNDFMDFAYLEDPDSKLKIYPSNVNDIQPDIFKFYFNTKALQIKKCYLLKLNFENSAYRKFEDDKLEHKYCTAKCDCNPHSSYKCGKNGECICHYPYKGQKCSECTDGFTFDQNTGKCVENLLNCDDAKTCSGHGKCVNDFNSNNNSKMCLCDDGFTSYSNEKNVFCNTCADPKRNWPYCIDKNEANNGSKDSLLLDSNIPCEDYPILYKKLFTDFEDEEKDLNTQDLDGSINFSQIFKVSNESEQSEILIPEDSIIRIFFHSFEINNAKVIMLENKYDEKPIAFTDGKEKSESFIARLQRKSTPYIIKVMHFNLKTSCNKYKLKIAIMPITQVVSHLKCRNNLNLNDLNSLLPQQYINLEASQNNLNDQTKLAFAEKEYFIPENLILDFDKATKNKEDNKSFNGENNSYRFTNTGILTGANVDESFIYNIKLDVKNSFAVAISTSYDFLTSDINIIIRDSQEKIIQYGKWIMQDDLNYEDSTKIRNEIQLILDPGVYYLAIKQNVPANHLLQILNDLKNSKNIKACFGFELHLQYNFINKPDQSISTKKYESMFNRIVDVTPTNVSNIDASKKLKILVHFEDSILPKLKDTNKTFKDVFYFQNIKTKSRLDASNIYLQGGLQKTFLIIFEQNYLPRDECFELIYNIDILSSEDKEKKILSDKPLTHKYCTKNCDCNPHTPFQCLENNECYCEEPYTGKGCYDCIEGYIMVNYKCISLQNCKNNFCSGHGRCERSTNNFQITNSSSNDHKFIYPICKCDFNFAGSSDCSTCTDPNLSFPDCEKLDLQSQENKDFNAKNHPKDGHKSKIGKRDYEDLKQEDTEELYFEAENSSIESKCVYPFIPFNLDTLGYLHLDGKFHVASQYSFKHFAGSHYSMTFTIKTRSHLKIYLEHSRKSHFISIFLLNHRGELLESGLVFTGPAGLSSASYLDLFLNPLEESGSYKNYKLNFYIKDVLEDDEIDPDINIEEKALLKDECFNAFLEMEIIPSTEEVSIIQSREKLASKSENMPYLIGKENSLFDYHTLQYEKLRKDLTKYNYIRDEKKYNLTDVVYFFHDYFYVPDHLDKEVILEIQILSDFLNAHIGILLEIVEIPTNIKFDHKKITTSYLKNIFPEIKSPICEVHCFTGVKKENAVILSRILPSDTYLRVWFYDLSPNPVNANANLGELNKNVEYELIFDIKNVRAKEELLHDKKEVSICANDPLPDNLNVKGYLGDSKYLQKWGFHILDSFRIDDALFKGLIHETYFEIKEFHLMRLVVFHGRIDSDIELYYKNANDYVLLARSNAKEFEDVLVVEISPGSYKIIFKFFPPASGFHKCESIRLEFSMNHFRLLQENVNRMVARHKNKPVFSKVDLVDMAKFEKDIFSRDFAMNRYNIPIEKPFFIDRDDASKFEPSIVIGEMSFTIVPEDDNKLELYAIVQSDFLYLDAAWYLTEISSQKIISSLHKKNMNILSSGNLESGTYILTLRYYRRLHSNNFDEKIKNIDLLKATFAEIDVNLSFINKDADAVQILTNEGFIKISGKGQKFISHNWLCRNKGIPIPKSLSNMRYMEFNTDLHILDNFLIPTMGEGSEIIRFKLKYSEKMMLRIYVECHFVDIDIQIRELMKNNEYKVLSESKSDIFFESLMELIKDNTEYEIVLFFKGANTLTQDELSQNNNCHTFKMEIALESNHNFACPESSKYAKLTELRILPESLPLKDNKVFHYDSRKLFLGEDKDSGYIYMIRKDYDQEIKFTEFNVDSEIDFKIEVLHDFMQSPLNIFLVREQSDKNNLEEDFTKTFRNNISNLVSNLLKFSNIDNTAILDFGEIHENRSTMIIKNLPHGKYSIYLYLPALKTTFINEPRVCSIYDVIIEAKKSRGHFKEKEILSISEIRDNNLNIPTPLPLSLNTMSFLETSKYINNHDYYYLRKNETNSNDEIVNNIKFEIDQESLVELLVDHDLNYQNIRVKIENETPSQKNLIKVLPKGKYEISISLSNVDIKNYHFNSMEHLILLYIGINPTSRVKDIYSYNNLVSSYHQCQTSTFPSSLKYNSKSKSFYYHVDDFKINRNNINMGSTTTSLGKMNFALTSKKNRILLTIGSDLIFNDLYAVISSENKSWESSNYKNNGFLDIIVPKGKYSLELQLASPVLVKEWECIILSLDIHIIDLDHVKDHLNHFKKHIFDTSKIREENKHFLQPKCTGEILPILISSNSENENSIINYEGEYNIHLNSAIYFDSHQLSKNNENLNEIEVNLKNDSLVRISVYNYKPQIFEVVPKLKQKRVYENSQNAENRNSKENILIRETFELVSHNKKERNIAWFVEKNSHFIDRLNNDDYLIQLEKEVIDKFTDGSSNSVCPNYSLDISINSVSNLSKKFECLMENGKILQYLLPQQKITKDKMRDGSYHEIIDFSYMTENQYSDIYTKNKQFDGFEYKVDFDIEEESYVSFEIGYDNSISLFDGYVVAYDKEDFTKSHVIATSDVYFDKYASSLFYKRHIKTNLTKGKYSIIILEHIWKEISLDVRSFSGIDNHLCLPFGYKLDIINLSQKNAKPEIFSIFPPGSYLFKSEDEDINIRISLSKSPFTHQHKQITNVENYMNIVEAFYFKIVPNKYDNNLNASKSQTSVDSNGNQENEYLIYPDKTMGSADGKYWELTFLGSNFEKEKNYKLEYDSNWLFDANYSKYALTISLPTFRIETKKEDIFSMADDIGKKKTEIQDKDKNNLKAEEVTVTPPQPPSYLANNKCGEHGKLVYDHILKRYHCSCLHGYTGKFCKSCEGKVNPVTKFCEIDEEDYEEDKASDPDLDQAGFNKNNYDSRTETYIDKPTYQKPNPTDDKNKGINNISPCGNCIHGYCDANLGRCVCEVGYTGRYCENLKNSSIKKDISNKALYSNESFIYNIFDKILKLM